MKKSTADAINILGQFCSKRDVECLNSVALLAKYSIPQADVFVLFGGSILAGGDLLAQAIKDQNRESLCHSRRRRAHNRGPAAKSTQRVPCD